MKWVGEVLSLQNPLSSSLLGTLARGGVFPVVFWVRLDSLRGPGLKLFSGVVEPWQQADKG